jgi:hypothetical protein
MRRKGQLSRAARDAAFEWNYGTMRENLSVPRVAVFCDLSELCAALLARPARYSSGSA